CVSALSDDNHMVWNTPLAPSISEFDATTGGAINSAFVNGQGLTDPRNLLFVPVPEPSSLLLPAAAGVAVCVRRLRRGSGLGSVALLVALAIGARAGPVQARQVL